MRDALNIQRKTNATISLLINTLLDNNPVPLLLYLLFISFETILFITLPLSVPTKYNSQYKSLLNILTSIEYPNLVISLSESAACLATVLHFIFCLSTPILLLIIAILGFENNTKHVKIISKIALNFIVLQLTFMHHISSRNFWAVLLNTLPYNLSIFYKIISVIGYTCSLLTYALSPMIFSVNPHCKVPWVGAFTFIHYERAVIKIWLSFYMCIDHDFQYSWIAALITIIPVCQYLVLSAMKQMFYLKSLYFAYAMQMSMLLVSMIIMVIVKAVGAEATCEDVLTVVIISVGISLLICIFQNREESRYVRMPIDKIESINDAEYYSYTIYRFIYNKAKDFKLLAILNINKKFLKISDQMSNALCHSINAKFSSNDDNSIIKSKYAIFNIIYCKFTDKFNQSARLKILYSNFLYEVSNNYFKSYFIINKAIIGTTNIHYLITAYQVLNSLKTYFETEEWQIYQQIKDMFLFTTEILNLSRNCRHVSSHMMKIFKSLSRNDVNMKELQSEVIKASDSIDSIEKCYASIQTMASCNMESYYRMCCLYSLVLTNNKYVNKYYEINEKRKAYLSLSLEQENIFDCNSEVFTIVMSGDDANIDSIVFASNDSTCILNYHPRELAKHSITLIMPPIFRIPHRGYIQEFQKTGICNVLNTKLALFAYSKDCTLIPIYIYVSCLTHISSTIRYIGFMKKQSAPEVLKTYNFNNISVFNMPMLWMCSIDGDIIAINDATAEMLGIPKRYLEIKKGKLDICAQSLIKDAANMIAHPEQYQHGASSVLLLSKIKTYLDYDIIDELKSEYDYQKFEDRPVYVKITKNEFPTIAYYIIAISIFDSEIPRDIVSKINYEEALMFNRSSTSAGSSAYIEESKPTIKVAKLSLYTVAIAFVSVLTISNIVLTIVMLINTVVVNDEYKNGQDSIMVHSKTGIYVINLVALVDSYIYNRQQHFDDRADRLLPYINERMQYFTTFYDNNGKEAIFSGCEEPVIKIYGDGSYVYTNASSYYIIMTLSEKITYFLSRCQENIDSINLTSFTTKLLNLNSNVNFCEQIAYESFIGGYEYFLGSQVEMMERFTICIDAIHSIRHYSTMLSVSSTILEFVVLTILVLTSIKMRKQKLEIYNSILHCPKEEITLRMLDIKQFDEINESNLELQNKAKQLLHTERKSKQGNEYANRKHTMLPLSSYTVISLAWVCAYIMVVIALILVLSKYFDETEIMLRDSQSYILMKMYTIEESYLFFLSCLYSLPVTATTDYSVITLSDMIEQIDTTKFFLELNEMAYDDDICSDLSTQNSTFYTSYVNDAECRKSYYNFLKHHVSDMHAFYLNIIESSYYMLTVEQTCGMSESDMYEFYELFAYYISPFILAEINQLEIILNANNSKLKTALYSYYSLGLVMLAVLIVMIEISNMQIKKEKSSIQKMQVCIRPNN